MDKIEVKITRNCDADGNGGEVVDHAAAILGTMPNGTKIVDAICAAFAESYGVHQIEVNGRPEPVSLYRNVAYRVRQHMTEIVSAYATRQAQAVASQQAQSAVDAALGSVIIVDQV
jgi:hypothetical protein